MHTKIITDKNIWENFAQNSYPTSFFQSWNWGEFQNKLNKEIIRLGFFDNDKLFAIANCIVIKAKRGKYLYIRNGPVMDWSISNHVEFVLDELKKIAKKNNLWFVRISPFIKNESIQSQKIKEYPISPMYDVDALDTWLLDITQDEDTILKNMRKSIRYEINKAKKAGVQIIHTNDLEYFEEFYKIYSQTVQRQKWNGYSKEFIKTQFETFANDNQASMFLAKYNNNFIAASIFIYYAESSNYHYSGSISIDKINGTPLIHWENILYAKKIGLKTYNFWGISPENKPKHPWNNLSFFKMGFGGYAQRWLSTRDIPVSPFYLITNIFEKIDKKKKGY